MVKPMGDRRSFAAKLRRVCLYLYLSAALPRRSSWQKLAAEPQSSQARAQTVQRAHCGLAATQSGRNRAPNLLPFGALVRSIEFGPDQ